MYVSGRFSSTLVSVFSLRVAVSSPTVRSFVCRVFGVQRTLSAEELSRDVEGLAANDNDLLALEELLSNGRGEATEEVALAIDGDLLCAVSFRLLSPVRSHPYIGILMSQYFGFDREC